jgi:hypothetical protein
MVPVESDTLSPPVRIYLFETGYAMANGMHAACGLNSEQQVLEHRAEDQ